MLPTGANVQAQNEPIFNLGFLGLERHDDFYGNLNQYTSCTLLWANPDPNAIQMVTVQYPVPWGTVVSTEWYGRAEEDHYCVSMGSIPPPTGNYTITVTTTTGVGSMTVPVSASHIPGATPVIVNPATDQQVFSSSPITIDWQPVGGVTGYSVEFYGPGIETGVGLPPDVTEWTSPVLQAGHFSYFVIAVWDDYPIRTTGWRNSGLSISANLVETFDQLINSGAITATEPYAQEKIEVYRRTLERAVEWHEMDENFIACLYLRLCERVATWTNWFVGPGVTELVTLIDSYQADWECPPWLLRTADEGLFWENIPEYAEIQALNQPLPDSGDPGDDSTDRQPPNTEPPIILPPDTERQ